MDFLTVFLQKKSDYPLYYQLYNHLIGEISEGRIAGGERLPSKRTAASQLSVSINTVNEAYQMLAAEGYVEAKPRSGFVVKRLHQLPVQNRQREHISTVPLLKSSFVQQNSHNDTWLYSFSSGGMELSLFPHKTWNRIFKEVLTENTALMERGTAAGDAPLRTAIASYLREWRAVRCTPEQIVVGAGLEVLCGMLARLFSSSLFAVESPGYPKISHILHNMGTRMYPVAVDEWGMPCDTLRKSGADIAYLTPSHQFPTGSVMPVGRRTELLSWASEGGLIIEDDYDSEFRFDGRPLPSLQGLDKLGRVVYAGTFSRSLAPGLRAAYLVLPEDILQKWNKAYGDYACTVSRPEQHTLAHLMRDGHFARHLNRARIFYRRRRDALIDALTHMLPQGNFHIENAHTGLYFVLKLHNHHDAVDIAAKARDAKIRLHALNEYYISPSDNASTTDALIIGYGGLSDEDIPAAAKALAHIISP